MIRRMIKEDLQQCGEIYAMAFPIEYWGIDWNSDNAREYLTDYYEQKKFIGYVYEEDDTIIGCIFAVCKLSGSKKEVKASLGALRCKIARDMKEKIEKEMQYPGTIKITVVRETRAVEEAK